MSSAQNEEYTMQLPQVAACPSFNVLLFSGLISFSF